MVGKTISHYRIVSQLGAGGMGVVYAAEDDRLGRSVALKFVPDELAKDHSILERLRGEARAAGALNHANICTVYDIGEYEGRPFIVMELLKGQTLRERLVAGPLKVHEILDYGIQIADGLDWAHTNGIIHRDIKPANLFLIDRGHIKIVDFGLAKLLPRHRTPGATGVATTDLTVAGTTLGTVAYMSPEQISGDDLDARTDIFSLGVVLYESVTGHQPFTGRTSAVVLSAVLNQAHVPPIVFNPALPVRLQEVINNCLEKDRELRYQNAGGLRADLKRIKRDLESGSSKAVGTVTGLEDATSPGAAVTRPWATPPPAASAPSQVQPVESAGRRTGLSGAVVALVAVIGVALAGAATYLLRPRPPQATLTPATGPSDVLIKSRLESAAASLRAKNYRAALSQAEEVLRAAPTQADAVRIRDEANVMVTAFDQAVAKATAMLAARDVNAATAAIDMARAIDPSAPVVNELSARLVTQLQSRAEAPRRDTPAGAIAGRDSSRPSGPVAASGPTSSPVPQTPPSLAAVPAPSAAPPIAAPPAAVASPAPASPAPSVSIAPPQPVPPGASPSAVRPTMPPSVAPSAGRETAVPPPASESDDTLIRRVVATYARAIETKDVALFRSIKPNMTPQEQQRLEEGFRAVSSQRVALTILAIDRRDQDASVRVRRIDTINAGGREQTSDTQQTMTLVRDAGAWVIRAIGR